MIGLVFLCALVVSAMVLLLKRRKIYYLHEMLKNETWSLPILVRMEAFQRFGRIAIKQGGLTSLWLGPRYFVVVADASIAEIVLKTCLAKDDIVNICRELFENGSIFASLQIWRPRRKVIAPTFSTKNLNRFVKIFSQQSSILVEQLKEAAGKGTFSIWKYLTTYTMDSVCESTLGVNVDAQRNPNQPFLKAFDELCQMAAARLVQPPIAQKLYTYLPIYKTYMKHIYCMWDFVDSFVKNKRKELIDKEVQSVDYKNSDVKEKPPVKTFLELFIESSGRASGFTDIELREETLVLLLAGTDTSAVGSAFTCLMLARHPDVQERLYEEIKEVLGNSDRAINASDLTKMKYLEAVVKETIRLYPPVPVIVRKVEKDLKLPSGLTIVEGTSFLINIWAVHHNPMYWGDDVEEFRPDRFIESGSIHTAAFIPFSHGPRSCLGYQYAMMSMKTAIANLIQHYRFLPATLVTDKNAPLRVKFDVMMKHVDNFELKVEART